MWGYMTCVLIKIRTPSNHVRAKGNCIDISLVLGESDFSLAPLLLTRLPRAPSRRNVIQYTRKCWYLLISMNACKRHFKLMEEGSTLIISTWLRCVFIMRPAFPLDFGSPYVVLSYYFKSISRRPILGTTSSHVASPWISVRGQRASPSSS